MQSEVGNFFSAPSSGAIAQGIRVKLNASGQWTTAGATELEVGTLVRDAFASQTTIPVAARLNNSPGAQSMVFNSTANIGDPVFTAANGKVSITDNRTSGGVMRGYATAAVTNTSNWLSPVLVACAPAT